MPKSAYRKSPAAFTEQRLDVIRNALLFAGGYISYVKEHNPNLHTEANDETEHLVTLATKYMKHEMAKHERQ